MIDRIIKALGGFTKHERDLLNLEYESWRDRAIQAEATASVFKGILDREQVRLDKLEGDIRAKPNSENQQPPNLNPVGDRRLSSWPRIRRELEKSHRVKDAEIPREEIERTIRGKE